jgi:hypothetical protein
MSRYSTITVENCRSVLENKHWDLAERILPPQDFVRIACVGSYNFNLLR